MLKSFFLNALNLFLSLILFQEQRKSIIKAISKIIKDKHYLLHFIKTMKQKRKALSNEAKYKEDGVNKEKTAWIIIIRLQTKYQLIYKNNWEKAVLLYDIIKICKLF